jgi:hypothetical protein
MKQTAVEWLEKELNWIEENKYTSYIELKIKQAKAMEREQIIEAVESTIKSVKLTDDKTAFFAMGGEGYYTEQYESNN